MPSSVLHKGNVEEYQAGGLFNVLLESQDRVVYNALARGRESDSSPFFYRSIQSAR
jgi:hypothetical protein